MKILHISMPQIEQVIISFISRYKFIIERIYFKKNIFNQKKIQEAISTIDIAIQSSEQRYCIGHFYKANSLQLQEKYRDAIETYKKALDLDQNFAQAYNNQGLCLNSINNYQGAIECFDQALEIDFCSIEAFNNKGQQLENLDRKKQALINYNNARILDKTFSKTYRLKGNLLINMKKYKEAVETYNQAIKYCQDAESQWFKKVRDEVQSRYF